MRDSGLEPPTISVIVPVLDEALIIERTLECLLELEGNFEVIVVDNGSTDDSYELASRWVQTIRSAPGRGPALNAGALRARSDRLLFLHADTTLPRDAFRSVEEALADPDVVGGCFSISFDGSGWQSRLVEALYRLFALRGFFYGDSAIFVRRSTFEAMGGFEPMPIMEDFDFCLRLRRMGRTARLAQRVVSSERRWRGQGFAKTVLVYLAIQGLYLLGIRHPRLFALYQAVR